MGQSSRCREHLKEDIKKEGRASSHTASNVTPRGWDRVLVFQGAMGGAESALGVDRCPEGHMRMNRSSGSWGRVWARDRWEENRPEAGQG